MRTDTGILNEIVAAFGKVERPEHFTNYKHCEECAEHDELLRNRDCQTLNVSDVGNPGWDPICFCSAEGIAYFMPALARIALEQPINEYGWYGSQLIFHLWSGGEYNAFFNYCNAQQRKAIVSLVEYFVESRTTLAEFDADEIFQVIELWGAKHSA